MASNKQPARSWKDSPGPGLCSGPCQYRLRSRGGGIPDHPPRQRPRFLPLNFIDRRDDPPPHRCAVQVALIEHGVGFIPPLYRPFPRLIYIPSAAELSSGDLLMVFFVERRSYRGDRRTQRGYPHAGSRRSSSRAQQLRRRLRSKRRQGNGRRATD